jgi:hypothetical protein
MESETLWVTLADGSEHLVVHPEGVAARDALDSLLHGPRGGWFYIGEMEWIRRDSVVRVHLKRQTASHSLADENASNLRATDATDA